MKRGEIRSISPLETCRFPYWDNVKVVNGRNSEGKLLYKKNHKSWNYRALGGALAKLQSFSPQYGLFSIE